MASTGINCYVCNAELGRSEVNRWEDNNDNGIDSRPICQECIEEEQDIIPDFEYEMHSDADIGL